MTLRSLFPPALAVLLAAGAAFAQEAAAPAGPLPAPACSAEAFRAFDFWIGEWTVRDSTGTEVGTNRITREADGCALLEQWKSTEGTAGTSLNYFDPRTGTWHQQWVGGGGLLLHLTGGMEGDEMVLTGRRATPRGEVTDRIRWKPLPDGRVQQAWDASSDGGREWNPVFLGFYEKWDGAAR